MKTHMRGGTEREHSKYKTGRGTEFIHIASVFIMSSSRKRRSGVGVTTETTTAQVREIQYIVHMLHIS
jgi:hypothetical protein